jgi:DNA-binding NtrC family response regulator
MKKQQDSIRILIMDDEETIQQLLQESLTMLGFEVVVTKDGGGAILAYKQALKSQTAFDVVLMDLIVQGGMGGLEAGKEIIRHDPQARLIATSGDPLDPAMMHPKLYGFTDKMEKPFNLRKLSSFIEHICTH